MVYIYYILYNMPLNQCMSVCRWIWNKEIEKLKMTKINKEGDWFWKNKST